MSGRLIFALAVAAACFVAPTASGQPNFSTSRGAVEPAAPYAGDVVRHVFTIANTGTSVAPVLITLSLRRGFLVGIEGDCASAKFDGSGNLEWAQRRLWSRSDPALYGGDADAAHRCRRARQCRN